MSLLWVSYANAEYPAVRDTLSSDTSSVILREVLVTAPDKDKARRQRSSQNIVSIERERIMENLGGSLTQTLDIVPGMESLNIGSSQSKPVIRGVGFNRIIVSENGVKHEGQQWGVDHGLEMNQFAVDNAEIVKGPAALLYGSDAIGGVLDISSAKVPFHKFGGRANLFLQSVNESLGLSVGLHGRPNDKFYYRTDMALLDYADSHVPTDSIQYHSYWIGLKDGRLRNTAGREYDGSLLLGYRSGSFHTDLFVSDIYAKSGFFADLHGLEVRLSDIDYDRSRRDIDLPYHLVNHLKITSNTKWLTGNFRWVARLGWQNNLRKEYAEAISHGYMPKPDNTLERRFSKDTWSATVNGEWLYGRFRLSPGLSFESQRNRIGGWGFIIPDFNVVSYGACVTALYSISGNLDVNAGIRIDRNHTHIGEYSDWFKTPVAAGDSIYKERASDMSRDFTSLTWAAGVSWRYDNLQMKLNIGKGFRVPTPQELGADGINYHIFRYEKGNPSLQPEKSYQLDAGFSWDNGTFLIKLDPFLNYFPNYIYLNPTPSYTEGMQTYVYSQSRVLRYGGELEVSYRLFRDWNMWGNLEYLYARQLSGVKKGYSLPFSPPATANIGIRYSPESIAWLRDGYAEISGKIVGQQHRIVPPERPTDSYFTVNAAIGKKFMLNGHHALSINLKVTNLLNRKYYNHMSYYRLSDIPEPGRNLSLLASWNF